MAKKDEKNIKDKTSFFKSFKAELKKVVWPTPKQLFNNTVAVLVIVIITAAIVFVLDFLFETMNKYGIDKVKGVVTNSTVEENVVEDEAVESDEEEEIIDTESESVDAEEENESETNESETVEDTAVENSEE